MKSSWFKAKDIGIATAHYPVTWQGWVVFFFGAALLVLIFMVSDASSHSASDTLIDAAPPAVAVLLFTNWITCRRCEKMCREKKQ
ncbi:MAG: hypothetical protein Q7R73_03540 [bacterium]|nr:hypothetical protein [bacterium]